MNGGNSKSYMEITVTGGIPNSIRKGDGMVGTDGSNNSISGIAYDNYQAGTEKIRFQYATGKDYDNHVSCRVGGLPDNLQETGGCKKKWKHETFFL